MRRIPLEVATGRPGGAVVSRTGTLRQPTDPDPRCQAEAAARIAAAESALSGAQQRASAAASAAELAQAELQRVRALRLQYHVSPPPKTAPPVTPSAVVLSSARPSLRWPPHHELEAARTRCNTAGKPSGAGLVTGARASGKVLKIAHKSEGSVTSGQPLVEIGDPGALEVEVDLLSADAAHSTRKRVVFERWGGEGALEGVVRMVEPASPSRPGV